MLPRLLFACACLLPAACTGPATHLHADAGQRVYVDGREVPRGAAGALAPLPFRYYGTGRWHAQPADRDDGTPDWTTQPASGAIAKPAPVSPWLFPLDFPLEVARRWLDGREDQHVQVVTPPTPPEQVPPNDVPVPGLAELTARATAARTAR